MPFSLISIIFVSFLQIKNKYFVAQISPFIINLILCFGIVSCYYNEFNVTHIGYSLLVSFLIRFFIQYHYSEINLFSFKLSRLRFHLDFIKGFIQATIIFSIIISIPFIIKSKSVEITHGNLSIFNYSYRIVDFVSVITSSIAMIIYPRISSRNISQYEIFRCFKLIIITTFSISMTFGFIIILLDFTLNEFAIYNVNILRILDVSYRLLPLVVMQTLVLFMLQLLYLRGCIKFCFIVSIFSLFLFIFVIMLVDVSIINLIFAIYLLCLLY